MNSRSPKMPAKFPYSSTAGSPGRSASITFRAAGPTGSSADRGSISFRVSLTMESGISSQKYESQSNVAGGNREREDRHRESHPEEGHEADRAPSALGEPCGSHVRGRGDDRRVAPEACPERERPPVGVVAHGAPARLQV